MATQVAALTYQSQLTESTTANNSQRQEQQMAQIAAVQSATHETLHHIIAGMNALALNVSDAGCGCYVGRGYAGHGLGQNLTQGRGYFSPAYIGGYPQGSGFPQGGGFPLNGPPGGFQGGLAGSLPLFRAPPVMNGGYGPRGGYRIPPGPSGAPRAMAQIQHQQPYSNVVKQHANWNACYSCGFDVADGHTSMSCLPHLCKTTHHIGFNR
jgi:hypothetical protein